jgi:hypothetical protein
MLNRKPFVRDIKPFVRDLMNRRTISRRTPSVASLSRYLTAAPISALASSSPAKSQST